MLIVPFLLIVGHLPLKAQDPFAKQKLTGVKGLKSVALVIRPNTKKELIGSKELGDSTEVGLHARMPELKIEPDPSKATAWLEVSIITADGGGSLELSVYRWVKVLDSGEEMSAKVWWDSRIILGTVSKKDIEETLETLLTSFAADYLRANK
jgi:hypothetical protein